MNQTSSKYSKQKIPDRHIPEHVVINSLKNDDKDRILKNQKKKKGNLWGNTNQPVSKLFNRNIPNTKWFEGRALTLVRFTFKTETY